jgi:hypothetical protein
MKKHQIQPTLMTEWLPENSSKTFLSYMRCVFIWKSNGFFAPRGVDIGISLLCDLGLAMYYCHNTFNCALCYDGEIEMRGENNEVLIEKNDMYIYLQALFCAHSEVVKSKNPFRGRSFINKLWAILLVATTEKSDNLFDELRILKKIWGKERIDADNCKYLWRILCDQIDTTFSLKIKNETLGFDISFKRINENKLTLSTVAAQKPVNADSPVKSTGNEENHEMQKEKK